MLHTAVRAAGNIDVDEGTWNALYQSSGAVLIGGLVALLSVSRVLSYILGLTITRKPVGCGAHASSPILANVSDRPQENESYGEPARRH